MYSKRIHPRPILTRLRFGLKFKCFFITCVPACCAKSFQSCLTVCDPVDYIACQVPLSIGFSRQEYWNRLPCPPPEDLPDLGIGFMSLSSPALVDGFFTTSANHLLPRPYKGSRNQLLLLLPWLLGEISGGITTLEVIITASYYYLRVTIIITSLNPKDEGLALTTYHYISYTKGLVCLQLILTETEKGANQQLPYSS